MFIIKKKKKQTNERKRFSENGLKILKKNKVSSVPGPVVFLSFSASYLNSDQIGRNLLLNSSCALFCPDRCELVVTTDCGPAPSSAARTWRRTSEAIDDLSRLALL